jgi:hypothetical protein
MTGALNSSGTSTVFLYQPKAIALRISAKYLNKTLGCVVTSSTFKIINSSIR